MSKPGFYKGEHYTEYIDDVQLLIKEKKLDEAEKLLLELLNAVESEARQNNWGAAPWYYDRLAVVYRKKKDTESEIRLLERFKHEGGGGARRRKLLERLEKLTAKRT